MISKLKQVKYGQDHNNVTSIIVLNATKPIKRNIIKRKSLITRHKQVSEGF